MAWDESFDTCRSVGLKFAMLNDNTTQNWALKEVSDALNKLGKETAWVSGKAFNGSWYWMDDKSKSLSCSHRSLHLSSSV